MKDALDEINAAFTKSTGIKVDASYAGSQTLVQLIEEGSRADVFLSADTDWMDYGIQKKVIKDDSCFFLSGNTLVLIASKDSKLGNVTIKPGFNLAQLAGNGLIAIGDVQAVPVGIYAKEALEKAWVMGRCCREIYNDSGCARGDCLGGARSCISWNRLRNRRQGRTEGQSHRHISWRFPSSNCISRCRNHNSKARS